MPVEVVSFLLSGKSRVDLLSTRLILQCAPFLKGVKVSCILNIEKELCQGLPGLAKETGIFYFILGENQGKCLVFFYRKNEFMAYLNKGEVQEFLRQYGYFKEKIPLVLLRLKKRVEDCRRRNAEFPHEIGAFLGYPIADVKGFIRYRGKGCLMSGYWKVYENISRAQMLFRTYDRAKICAVNEFLSGKSIKEIVETKET